MRPTDPRLLRRLAPGRRPLVGLLAAGVVSSLLVIAQAWAVAGLVLAVLDDGAQPHRLRAAALVVGVFALRGVVGWAGDACAATAASLVGTELRREVVLAAVGDPDGASTGSRAVLATRGVSAAEPYLTRYLPALVLGVVLPPLTVVAIATQDLLSAVIVLATLPLVPVFGALVGLATRDRAQRQWQEMSSLSGHFLDVLRGLPTLVAHRRARAQSARIGAITERHRVSSMATLRLAFASSAVLELVATLSVALVAVTVGLRLAGGSLGLGTALVVLLLAPEAYWPLRRVGSEFHAAAEGIATFEAVDALLVATGPAAPAVPAVPAVPATSLPEAGPARAAGLVLDDVSVTYPGRSVPALDQVTARIAPSGVTVVTGPSGCGKSTLLAVVAGLLDPTGGAVTAGGHPTRGADWQAQVAWLPQRPLFVAGSIADNLRLARPEATDDEVWSALEQVALAERVRSLAHGLAEPLGQDGATLSAGERARLALARVVLAQRPWSLLDEPTAHVDPITERILTDVVAELGRRGGVVMVAHGATPIGVADAVLALPAPAGSTAPAAAPRAAPVTGPVTGPVSRETRTVVADEEAVPSSPPGRGPGFGLSTLLGALASASGVALTATAGWLIVQASSRPAVLTLLVAIIGVRAFGLARPALRYAERLRSHDAALRLLARRRVEVYDALVPLTPARLGRRRGDLLTAVADDVDGVVDHQLRVLLPVRTCALVCLAATGVAATLSWAAAVVVAAGCAVAGVGGWATARRATRGDEREAVSLRAGLSAAVVDCVHLAPDLVMWQATGRAVDDVVRTSSRMGVVSARAARRLGLARGLALTASGAAVAGVALVTGTAVDAGTLTGPTMALLVLLPLALLEVVTPVCDAGALSTRTDAAGERLRRLERTAPAVRDTVASPAPATHEIGVQGAQARWGRDAPLTGEVSLTLDVGERVAVVGPSGSGKSTLAALLLRFLDPVSGRVTLGGAPTRDLALDDVRRLVGLVDDDPHVFATTLVENVRLARPDASDDEVEAALRDARLGAWLDALPDGLDTWLGDGHAHVSGGERARIAIARSLLADQPVLVLDEPTAHLDHHTAGRIADQLLTGPRARSVLWITHDTVGLDLADRVVDLGVPRSRPVTAARDLSG